MAESDWDTVTVLRKKGPTAAQAKSKQVRMHTSLRLFFFCAVKCTLNCGAFKWAKTVFQIVVNTWVNG